MNFCVELKVILEIQVYLVNQDFQARKENQEREGLMVYLDWMVRRVAKETLVNGVCLDSQCVDPQAHGDLLACLDLWTLFPNLPLVYLASQDLQERGVLLESQVFPALRETR